MRTLKTACDEVLLEDLSLPELAITTGINGTRPAPADKRLGRAEMELANRTVAREAVLKPKAYISKCLRLCYHRHAA